MDKKGTLKTVILGISILMGLMLLGFFIFRGFKTLSDKDRVVTVKGLAEMDIEAQEASIHIQLSASGDDFQKTKKEIDSRKAAILQFLTENGFVASQIKASIINVNDRQRYSETVWRNGKEVEVKIDRYVMSQTLFLAWTDIQSTESKAAQLKMDLISKDLTARVEAHYVFPSLNSIKPQLIAESTQNARVAGEQFANDSQSKLGKIKTASQGQISIAGQGYYYEDEESKAPEQPFIQRARVVSTIVFFLE